MFNCLNNKPLQEAYRVAPPSQTPNQFGSHTRPRPHPRPRNAALTGLVDALERLRLTDDDGDGSQEAM